MGISQLFHNIIVLHSFYFLFLADIHVLLLLLGHLPLEFQEVILELLLVDIHIVVPVHHLIHHVRLDLHVQHLVLHVHHFV